MWLIVATVYSLAVPQTHRLETILARAGEYADTYRRTFSTIICNEIYTQEVWERRYGTAASSDRITQRRVLRSEFIFLSLPPSHQLLGFRDVVMVDGRRVARQGASVQDLLSRAQTDKGLSSLLAASAAYNIGPILRNFNEPMLALVPLEPALQPRFEWRLQGQETIGGAQTIELGFQERRTPTIVKHDDQNVFLNGSIWVDPNDGHVVRTRLAIVDEIAGSGARGVRLEMTVAYRRDAKLDLWVPSRLKEIYTYQPEPAGPRILCEGTYSNYRRFETGARLVK